MEAENEEIKPEELEPEIEDVKPDPVIEAEDPEDGESPGMELEIEIPVEKRIEILLQQLKSELTQEQNAWLENLKTEINKNPEVTPSPTILLSKREQNQKSRLAKRERKQQNRQLLAELLNLKRYVKS